MLPSRSFQLISISSLILLAIASPANAQRLSIGGRLGLDFARLDLPSGAGLDTRTGFSVGGFVGYHLSKRFAVQPELSFVTKGAESAAIFISYHEGTPPELNPLVTNVQIDYKLSYLELQVPLTLMIPAGSAALAPRLYLGPSLAVEVGCETGAEVSGAAAPTAGCFADTEPLDFGAIFGAGFDTRLGSGALTLDVRYNLGLQDINAGIGGTVKNRVLQLLVGYAHFFGG